MPKVIDKEALKTAFDMLEDTLNESTPAYTNVLLSREEIRALYDIAKAALRG